MAASRHLAWAHGTLAERRSRRLARCRSTALGAQALRVREITPDAPGPLQSGPAHAAWEDRELGLVAVVVCGKTQISGLVIYDTMYRSIYHAVPAGNLQCVVRLAVLLDGDVVAVDLTSCPRFVGHYTPSVIRQEWARVEPAQAYGV